MTFETFCAYYKLQLMLGETIDFICKNEIDNDQITLDICEIADNLGKRLKNNDAHWLINPPSKEDAYKIYTSK